ncbi:MAG TPA: hypothetical protein VGQ46_04390 [Thermoanaerobaculia bacterium]|nr:hypothetical protein [Thermoanaerobaculia bacterium]
MKIPEEVLVWSFGGKAGKVKSQNEYSTDNSGNGYNMHCRTNDRFLTYVKTTAGISLGYESSKDHKIHFRVMDGKERPILSGEKVAFGIGGGNAFLRYAHRTVGINLDWSGNPIFEWLIYSSSANKGEPIPTGSPVAMINEKVQPDADFLVYMDRPGVAHVGWTSSPDWRKKITNWLTEEAFKKLVGGLL